MSDNANTPLDQTVFGESAPLMDEHQVKSVTPETKKEEIEVDKPKRPVKKPLPLPVLLGGITMAVLLVMGLLMLMKPGTPGTTPLNTPAPTEEPTISSNLPEGLQKAIASLEIAVKEADPQANDLPFPPVNFELHLRSPETFGQ